MTKSLHFLIIDDDEISNYITSKNLKLSFENTTIHTALNGLEAVNYLQDYNTSIPDLILLDINMPLMDGFEFLEWYQKSNFNGSTRICMLTTSIREEDKEKAKSFGDVIDYLEKPISKKTLTHIV